LQLHQDVRTAYANLKIAEQDVIFYRDRFIPQQADNIRIAEENFRRGSGDFDSYLGALHDYAAAQQAYLAALQTYHDNGQALETAVGARLPCILRQSAAQPDTQPATMPSSAPSPADTRPAGGASTLPADATALRLEDATSRTKRSGIATLENP
jgi:hypothetical protein